MNEFFDLLFAPSPETLFTSADIVAMMTVSALCLFILSRTYQVTHRGTSYTQSYIHALFLMGFCTGIVMMIIGSNIARAFSLVGALSIIRFRTAVKDTRDTAYLFFAIIVGMGCGTGFYVQTVVFTLLTCIFMWALYRLDYAEKTDVEEILKITFRRGSGAPEAIETYLGERLRGARLINSIRSFERDEDTVVYVVRDATPGTVRRVAEGLEEIDGVTRTAHYVNDQQVGL